MNPFGDERAVDRHSPRPPVPTRSRIPTRAVGRRRARRWEACRQYDLMETIDRSNALEHIQSPRLSQPTLKNQQEISKGRRAPLGGIETNVTDACPYLRADLYLSLLSSFLNRSHPRFSNARRNPLVKKEEEEAPPDPKAASTRAPPDD